MAPQTFPPQVGVAGGGFGVGLVRVTGTRGTKRKGTRRSTRRRGKRATDELDATDAMLEEDIREDDEINDAAGDMDASKMWDTDEPDMTARVVKEDRDVDDKEIKTRYVASRVEIAWV